MTGTFGSLNIAKTGLQYQQIAIDTASNNIANVNNEDYVRRRAVASEVGGTSTPVMWSTYTGHGDGVTAESVQRVTSALLDNRVRNESGTQSYLEAQQASLSRVESAIGEPGDNGVSAALDGFVQSWQDLVSNPGGDGSTSGPAARLTVISKGQDLAAAINAQARNVVAEADTQVVQAKTDVNQINSDAQQIATLNHSIFLAQASGTDVSDLEDKRDALMLDIAKVGGAVSTQQSDGQYNVTINGLTIVQGDKAGSIAISTSDGSGTAGNTAPAGTLIDGDPNSSTYGQALIDTATGDWSGAKLTYKLTYPDGGSAIAPITSLGGDLGGVTSMLTTTPAGNGSLADYKASLDKLAQQLANTVNDVYSQGYDLNGNAGSSLAATPGDYTTGNVGGYFFTNGDDPESSGTAWSTSYTVDALHLTVNSNVASNPNLIAASAAQSTDGSGNPVGNYDATNADKISEALLGSDGSHPSISGIYQSMITGLGTTINSLNTQTANQQSLTTQVTSEREQQVGVSIDEETINLMQAEKAYQASARVLSTMDSILDTLINGM